MIFHTSFEEITGPQLFCIVYLSSTSPSSQTGGCFCSLAIAVTGMLSAVDRNTSTTSNLIIISQLNHFTFVSALLLPVLRLNLTLPLRLQGLGTGGWLDLTRQDFPAIYNQLTKASRVSPACQRKSAWLISQLALYPHYNIKISRCIFFIYIHPLISLQ